VTTDRRTSHRTLAALLLALLAALLVGTAGPAAAHAALVETVPADGAQVDAVDEIRLRFNEAVTVPTGGIRVYDSEGTRVDDGTASLDGSDTVVAPLSGLSDGTHVATYRITSEDGHVVRGALVFTVGEAAGGIDDGLLTSLVAAGDSPVATALGVATRAATMVALLVLGGALLALVRVVSRDDDREAARAWVRRAAWASVVLAVVAVPVQSMSVTGLGLLDALAPAPLGETLSSTVGQAAVVRLVAAGAVLVLVGRAADTVTLAAGGVALGSLLLDGHTRTVEPTWLMVAGDTVHLAAGAWPTTPSAVQTWWPGSPASPPWRSSRWSSAAWRCRRRPSRPRAPSRRPPTAWCCWSSSPSPPWSSPPARGTTAGSCPW
jgi:copper transport protein